MRLVALGYDRSAMQENLAVLAKQATGHVNRCRNSVSIRECYAGSAAHPRPIVAILGVEHAQHDGLTPAQRPHVRSQRVCAPSRDGARDGHNCRERFSKRYNIMPGCNAWIAQLSRGSTAAGSNVFLAGECLGIVGTILYFSRDFSYSLSACPPANVTYNQAVQTVTADINARPQRIQERFIDLATEALHDAWPCKPNLK
jgi:Rap1a immunity proteins